MAKNRWTVWQQTAGQYGYKQQEGMATNNWTVWYKQLMSVATAGQYACKQMEVWLQTAEQYSYKQLDSMATNS